MPSFSPRRRGHYARPRLDWLEDRTNPSVFNPAPDDTLTLSGAASAPNSIALGDLTGDGFLDVAVANFGTETIDIYTSALTGAPDQTIDAAGLGPTAIAIADVDLDGLLERPAPHHGHDRAEDLFLRNSHRRIHVGKDRGFVEPSARVGP